MFKLIFFSFLVVSCSTGSKVTGNSKTNSIGVESDVIRRILRDHIPQFRACYLDELERKSKQQQDGSGSIRLLFTITSSGDVEKAAADKTNMSQTIKRCVVNVLSNIKFPEPIGGGTVEVRQPFNFYPKRT